MHNHFLKWTHIFFILVLVGSNAFSQQGNAGDKLVHQFTEYQLNNFQEKIFVHIDKSFYLTGEIIWFKIYDVDGYFHKPVPFSNIAYVELVSGKQKPVLQAKIEIDSSTGNGFFIIPFSLASGIYQFRAYTAWMKNFSPDFYFHQAITIVNTIVSPNPVEKQNNNTLTCNLFPEGGNLVYGLSSRIAFKIFNQHGEGISAKGYILDQNKDTITRFQSSLMGMGSFILKPEKGSTYSAVLNVQDTVITKKIDFIFNEGWVMSLSEMGDRINILVDCNKKVDNPAVFLFSHTRGVVKKAQVKYLINGEVLFSVDKKLLGDGITHFTVFNQEQQPVCERLYFKLPVRKMLVAAIPEQDRFNTRSKVNINIDATDQHRKPISANLSMSVFYLDSLQPVPRENISNFLLLTSELKGFVEFPDYYLTANEKEAGEAADNLMLTQGWSRFRWEDILESRIPYFEFLPEIEGPLITGKITDRKTGKPASNVTAFMSIPGKQFDPYNDISDLNGSVRFPARTYHEKNEVIFMTDSNYRMEIVSPFSDRFSDFSPHPFPSLAKPKDQLIIRSVNSQAENSYLRDKKFRFIEPVLPDTTTFYGKSDKQYNLDDYTRFVTMEEVMREYIAEVRVRKQAGTFHFRVLNSIFNTFFEDNPLVLLDGVPVFNINKIIAFDPSKIKRIEIITHKYYKNRIISDGIVSYKTYNGDLGGYELDPADIVFQYEGIKRDMEFYSPVYDSSHPIPDRIPDLRNLLQWSPQIHTDASGRAKVSFYTSDVTGKFAIVLQGISNDGMPGNSVSYFTVTK